MTRRNSMASLLGAILIGTSAFGMTLPAQAGKGNYDRQEVRHHQQDRHRHAQGHRHGHRHGHKTLHRHDHYYRHGGHRYYPDYGRYRDSHQHPHYAYGHRDIGYPHRGHGDSHGAWDVVIRYSLDD